MLQGLSDQVAELHESKSRRSKTLEEAGLEAWENGSMGTGDLSYYTKGSVAGLVLDAAIRSRTQGKKSLDDVMRLLFSRHRLPNPGFEEGGLLKAINEVSGHDLSEVYRQVVQSTQEMPYEELQALGLRVRMPGDGSKDLGFRLDGDLVSEVEPDLAAQGLQKGDRLLSVGQARFGHGCFARLGSAVEYSVSVHRSGEERRLRLKVLTARTKGPTLEADPFASAEAEQRREEWLRRNVN
jgi:predicted metalloprotease with PDZ domain